MMTESAMRVTERFFDALEAGDIDAVSDFYSEDVAVWHNFTNATMGKQQNLDTLKGMLAAVDSLQYVVTERIDLGDRVLQRHTLTCHLADGQVFKLPACLLITVRGNQVVRIDEYLDTGQANALRRATHRPEIQSWLFSSG